MRELFNRLEKGQKRVLAWGAGFLAAALVFLLVAALGSPRSARRRAAEAGTLRRQWTAAESERDGRRLEVARWEEARRDLEMLRNERFYRERSGVNELRLDLQKLFSGAGMRTPETKFDYAALEKERARKVSIAFNFEGSYARLKGFLAAVEREDRFLFVERIIFQNIDSATGSLLLKVTLAAYDAF
jgi:hypothetical protein